MTAIEQLQPLDRDELMEDVAPAMLDAIRAWDKAINDVGQSIDALVKMFPSVDADLWWESLVDNVDNSRPKTPLDMADKIATLFIDHAARMEEASEEVES